MPISVKSQNRSILDMPANDAETFLLKEKSYCTIDLPSYFSFEKFLSDISKFLKNERLSDYIKKLGEFSGVNHKIQCNKDGRYGWRSLELCHPVLYVDLVNLITGHENWPAILESFSRFQNNNKIQCLSMPVESLSETKDKAEQILHWWSGIEQKSIELALSYDHVIHTDITDCYGSIYTHSIAWSLHGKQNAKNAPKDQALIGNAIDRRLQQMQHQQTNGMPQGSVLMDFIAEIVLGYADTLLTEKIKKQNLENYKILRYRDDYRIFVNDSRSGEVILKYLTEALFELGLKLNPSKTITSSDVIQSSVKNEKLHWITRKQSNSNLQKHLLIIHDHSSQHPNAGSLIRALEGFSKRLKEIPNHYEILPLVSIVVDIAYHSPKTYPVSMVIISKLLEKIPKCDHLPLLEEIKKKFSLIPNVGFLEIWLQRLTLPRTSDITFDEPLCKLASNKKVTIWNNDWIISKDLRTILDTPIVSRKKISHLTLIVALKEIQLFNDYE
ncbi:MAG: RNA-directed DNA polymerase [Phycisphaeraceae bacterium]|nr:RNA-directed DNA polymerase [Phycisphaeraceae bacterium]